MIQPRSVVHFSIAVSDPEVSRKFYTEVLGLSCVKILSNCRNAMAPNGRIVIANQDIPSDIGGPHPNLTMDIQMMTLLGGRERTVTQWSALFRQCGLRLGDVFPTDVGFTLIEAAPE